MVLSRLYLPDTTLRPVSKNSRQTGRVGVPGIVHAKRLLTAPLSLLT